MKLPNYKYYKKITKYTSETSVSVFRKQMEKIKYPLINKEGGNFFNTSINKTKIRK